MSNNNDNLEKWLKQASIRFDIAVMVIILLTAMAIITILIDSGNGNHH
jgi:hypothetical protein